MPVATSLFFKAVASELPIVFLDGKKEQQICESAQYLLYSRSHRLQGTRSPGLSIADYVGRCVFGVRSRPHRKSVSLLFANAALGLRGAWLPDLCECESLHLTLLGVFGTCYVIRPSGCETFHFPPECSTIYDIGPLRRSTGSQRMSTKTDSSNGLPGISK